jgi:branched-chain amino acid aminotransferase
MSDTSTLTIKVSPIEKSRFKPFENDNLVMGRNFTDHMLVCDYENGAWKTPEIVPYGDMAMSPALAALHYGQSIFEGVKAYRQPDGSVAIFRPDANWARMNVSAKRMDMPEIPKEIFIDGLRKLLEIDNQWIPGFPETSLYIRPFMFSTDAFIGVVNIMPNQ